MAEVIDREQRTTARQNLNVTDRNIQIIRGELRKLQSQKALREVTRHKRRALTAGFSKELSKEMKERDRYYRLSRLPTRAEYEESRRKQLQRALYLAKKAIRKGVPTAYLSGEVKKIVKRYREEKRLVTEGYAQAGQTTVTQASKVGKAQSFSVPKTSSIKSYSNVSIFDNRSILGNVSTKRSKKIKWL